MKKFIFRLGLVLFVVLMFCITIKSFYPFYWGGNFLGSKIEYIMEHPDDFNTVVIGSSHINKHLDPIIFDQNNSHGTKTYNLGMSGMFFLESDYNTENILKQNLLPNVENIIYLVEKPSRIRYEELHTNRGKYFMDWKRMMFALKYFRDKPEYVKLYAVTYLENLLCIGELKRLFLIKYNERTKRGQKKMDRRIFSKQFGYTPYEQGKVNKNRLEQRKNSKVQQLETITYKEQLVIDQYKKLMAINPEINFYFLHLPDSRMVDVMKDFNNIHMKYPDTFPEYYDLEYQHDGQGHLNTEGAKLFSKYLGKLFDKAVK